MSAPKFSKSLNLYRQLLAKAAVKILWPCSPMICPIERTCDNRIAALIAFAEITSSIELTRVENGRAELDWYMEIRARATASVVERRRQKVTIRVEGRKIREFRPVEFFRLPAVR